MIMVDVYVPAYDQTYDMEVDEGVLISLVIEEMVNVVCQKEKSKVNGRVDEFCLCASQRQTIFSPERCLRDYGITTGSALMLV